MLRVPPLREMIYILLKDPGQYTFVLRDALFTTNNAQFSKHGRGAFSKGKSGTKLILGTGLVSL
jgi:hypothetical protein